MLEKKDSIIKFVEKCIKENIAQEHTLKHHLDTRNFLLELKPNASLKAQIAALTHDIERQSKNPIPTPKVFSDNKYLLKHGEASADIVTSLLKKQGFKLDFEKLRKLITYHEIGGDLETSLIRDADSISFLKNTVKGFIQKFSKEECEEKFGFMFNRIANKKAKSIAEKYYNEALKLLGGYYGNSKNFG